ncbi:Nucleic-acid-binding protein from transposon X-element, partial [Stegodyphus mimosarum]
MDTSVPVNDKPKNLSSQNQTVDDKKSRIPPITLKENKLSWKEISNILHENNIQFHGETIPTGIKVITQTPEEYRKIIHILKDKQVEHHSYILPEDRHLKVVLRGLTSNTLIEDIKSDLETLNYEIKEIKQMTRRRNGEVTKLPLFLISLPKNDKSKEIYNERYLCDMKIKFKEYLGRQGPLQCFRCQGFNHTQAGCNYAPKCVRCGNEHYVKDCPDRNNPEKPLFCVNCGGSHTSSFRGCEKFPKRKPEKTNTHNSRVFENKSYGQALSTGLYSDTLSEAKQVFS